MIAKRSFLQALGAAALLSSPLARVAAATDGVRRTLSWSAWRRFAAEAVSAEGRLIDPSDARQITTSEGQSYGLFFALVDDDRELFERLRRWTVDNLCAGDAGKNLPAWLWGKTVVPAPKTADSRRAAEKSAPVVRWGVIDANNATDADLWIAYALLEAGRLWKEDAYREEGLALLDLVGRTCLHETEAMGPVCLPGRTGFVDGEGRITFNPSYTPPQLLRRFAAEDPRWLAAERAALRATLRASPAGAAPDWAVFDESRTLVEDGRPFGSWDAVRVYLWAGMLPQDAPERDLLVRHFAPVFRLVRARGSVPERIDTRTLAVSAAGPDAFGAAFLAWRPNSPEGDLLRARLEKLPIAAESYYKSMLTLFGLGFDDARFAFDREGRLLRPIRSGVRS